jgi:hypothetical protein
MRRPNVAPCQQVPASLTSDCNLLHDDQRTSDTNFSLINSFEFSSLLFYPSLAMSFGWSAGDIVAALKLLYQIGIALRDLGGASSEFQDTLSFLQTLSRTLQHLNALQATPLDTGIVENLREQCNHIRVPLTELLDDVGRRFGPTLGVNSTANSVFAAPWKIQWALSTSKKIKRLQDRIAVPMAAVGLMLGQQVM